MWNNFLIFKGSSIKLILPLLHPLLPGRTGSDEVGCVQLRCSSPWEQSLDGCYSGPIETGLGLVSRVKVLAGTPHCPLGCGPQWVSPGTHSWSRIHQQNPWDTVRVISPCQLSSYPSKIN